MSKEIEDHRLFNHSHNQPFAEVLAQHVSRRDVMRGGLGLAAASMLGFGGAAQALAGEQAKTPLTLAFEAVGAWFSYRRHRCAGRIRGSSVSALGHAIASRPRVAG